MLNVACVLRSGGEYRAEHVAALRDGVARHLTLPHKFVCLSDVPVPCERISLKHDWPKWWPKIELFSGALDGPVFFADLDTIIVGPLDDLVLGHRFTVLENFWSAERIGSGLMAWDTDLSAIYRKFCLAPAQFMREYVTTERWGDQGFIRFNSPVKPGLWQHRHPGKVVSYKRHVVPAGGVPEGAVVVCFHGAPRPWRTPLWRATIKELEGANR